MSVIRSIIPTFLRWALGALFIFSGLVKCVDPVGTAIFVDKYLATYSVEWLMPLSETFAIALSVFEFMLGVLLVAGVWRRLVALISTIVLLLFSVVTFLSATVLPIGDCGCFGEAIKLSPWATFLKNILFLILAIYLWRCSEKTASVTLRELTILAVAITLPLGVNIYALSHLPLVDFLPYKVGINLSEEIANEQESLHTILRFKSVSTGEMLDFDATDTACWMDSDLEFIESLLVSENDKELVYNDFHLYNQSGVDVTSDILDKNGRIALLCINDATNLSLSELKGIEHLCSIYPATSIFVVSSEDIGFLELPLDTTHLYIDAMTLRSIIRADIGVVILNNGTVEFKANIKDI